MTQKDYDNLNSFFWLFSLDLKSSKRDTQNIILQWIEKNNRYNSRSWKIDIIAKRVIAWISNSKLTYEDAGPVYRSKFNNIIKKQINHLINTTISFTALFGLAKITRKLFNKKTSYFAFLILFFYHIY